MFLSKNAAVSQATPLPQKSQNYSFMNTVFNMHCVKSEIGTNFVGKKHLTLVRSKQAFRLTDQSEKVIRVNSIKTSAVRSIFMLNVKT